MNGQNEAVRRRRRWRGKMPGFWFSAECARFAGKIRTISKVMDI